MATNLNGPELFDILGSDICTLKSIFDENANSLESRLQDLLRQCSHMTLYGIQENEHHSLDSLEAFKWNVAYVCDHFSGILQQRYAVLKSHDDGVK